MCETLKYRWIWKGTYTVQSSFAFFIHTRSSKEKKNENWILPRSLFTSSSSSSEPSTLPPEWPGCPSAPSPSSSGLSLCKTKSRKTKIHSWQKPLVVPGLVERSVVVLQYYSMYSLDLANTRSIISFEFIWCRHRYSSTLSSVPVHDLTELLSGQEAWVLPDLPQSSLELLLVLVFESLLVPLLFAAASLLAVVQPEEWHRGWSDISNTHTPCVYTQPDAQLTLRLSWVWTASEGLVSSSQTPVGC